MMHLNIDPRKLLQPLVGFTFILTIFSLISIVEIWDVRFRVLRLLFDFNDHITISTWYALILFLIAAVFAGSIAWDHTERGRPFTRHWGYLAIVFVLMCVDEFTNLHNRILTNVGDSMGGGDGVFHYAWIIPGLMIVAGFALFFLPFFIRMPPTPRNGIVGGLAIFVAGAVGIEMITGWVLTNHDVAEWLFRLLYNVEELTEKIGMCIVIWGLAHYLRDNTAITVRLEGRPPSEA
jgi:hypothetical protein